jgi:acetyltransferase
MSIRHLDSMFDPRSVVVVRASERTASGGEETLGVVRSIMDPDNATAEFAIIVRSDLKGSGMGELLMRKLIAFQRGRGTKRLAATVLRENRRMLDLAESLGFVADEVQPDQQTRAIHVKLD